MQKLLSQCWAIALRALVFLASCYVVADCSEYLIYSGLYIRLSLLIQCQYIGLFPLFLMSTRLISWIILFRKLMVQQAAQFDIVHILSTNIAGDKLCAKV